MTVELLAAHRRRAAHGDHQCALCYRLIDKGEVYEDLRLADGGVAWTSRVHLLCQSAYYSWQPDGDELFADLTDGHLPPCPFAWDTPNSSSCLCPNASGRGAPK